MSSLATHTLYTQLNTRGLSCERAFLEHGPLRSLETRTELRTFDFIAITSSFELDWLSIPQALAKAGLPPRRRDRSDHPLILMGGPAITAAPLPLSGLYDAALIGEIEPVLSTLCTALQAPNHKNCLEQLAAIPGFYVPDIHGEPGLGALRRRCARQLDDFETASVILTPHTEFANRFLVEMGRGCGRGCAFCLARQAYRPLRWRSLSHLLQTIRNGLRHTLDLGLIAAAVSDYPELDTFCHELIALSPELRISTSSIRLETASSTLLQLLARGGQQTVTYAPEAATERLRQVIGKAVSETEIFAAMERALGAGLTRLRLYFMVGLPGELEADRAAISVLVRDLSQAFPQVRLRINIGAFSPRPHTPLESEPIPDHKVVQGWINNITRDLRPLHKVEVASGSAREAAVQALLSHMDASLLDILLDLPDSSLGPVLHRLTKVIPSGQPWKVVDFTCAD